MRAHRTDVASLVFGLVFLGATAWWVFDRSLDVELPRFGWFLAAALIVFGVLGLLGALRSGRRSTQTTIGADEKDPGETHLP